MNQYLRIIIFFYISYNIVSCRTNNETISQDPKVRIIPQPNKILLREGSIRLTDEFWVIADVANPLTAELAETLVNSLKNLTSKTVGITDLYSTRKHKQSFLLELKKNYITKGEQAYSIEITSSHVKIISGTGTGLFYGIQSLLQILQAHNSNGEFIIPKMNIKDKPIYQFRGVLLDPNKHSNAELKNIMETLAKYKLNHFYLTEKVKDLEIFKSLAAKNYTKLSMSSQIPKGLSLISYNASREEMKYIFNTNKNNIDTRGFLLDLTSTAAADIEGKAVLLSELSWSSNKNREFTDIYP